MKVLVGFEAQVHSRLDSVVLEGYYILASLLGPSSGVGIRQMWMQAQHKQPEGLQLEPHSLSVELFLEVHNSIVVLLLAHHSQFGELSVEPHSLFEGLSVEPHSLFEELSVEPRSLDGPAGQLQSSHLLH
jgi:hypothetical protein